MDDSPEFGSLEVAGHIRLPPRACERFGLARAGRNRDPPAELPVDLDGEGDLLLDGLVRIELGPGGRLEDAPLRPQPLPELLGDVRAEGGQHDDEWLHLGARCLPVPPADSVQVLHHRRDRGVELELRDLGRHLPDRPVKLALDIPDPAARRRAR